MGPTPDIVVDGVPAGVRRWKVLELAAMLAIHRDGIDRGRLQLTLFPDADRRRAGNYLRQVVHKLRQVTSVELDRDSNGRIGWPTDLWIDTTDLRIERLVASSQRVFGADRLRRLEEAVELATGPYLADSALEWIEARRFELEVTVAAAAQEACLLAWELGEFFRARTLAMKTLELDPYCEAAFRVLLRVEATVGTPTAATTVIRRLGAALNELVVGPEPATLDLLREVSPGLQISPPELDLVFSGER
jgi:DNA-binding SARP family transcriptional activator